MALKLHPVANKEKSRMLCEAFAAGAPANAEGHVFYGVKDDNYAAWRQVLKRREPYYFIDGSYFDSVRGQQFRVTKNAIQVRDARSLKTDGKRFANLGLAIKPRRSNPDGHWLVIEQSEVFMRLTANYPGWLDSVVRGLPPEHPVRVRRWGNAKLKMQQTIEADLVGCWALVTHTSAAAVTATLAGIPSMVNSRHALSGMICGHGDRSDPDERYHFLSVLADFQFSVNEMREGVAWQWLNK